MNHRQLYTNSTGARKDLEIIVPVYTVSLLPSKVDEINSSSILKNSREDYEKSRSKKTVLGELSSRGKNGDNLETKQTTSEFDCPLDASESLNMPTFDVIKETKYNKALQVHKNKRELKTIQIISQSALDTHTNDKQDYRKNSIVNFSSSDCFLKFGLKEEDMRQGILSQFKFCMKKIVQDLKKYKKLTHTNHLRLISRISNLYVIDRQNRDFVENVLLEMRSLIDQTSPNFIDESSYKNALVGDIFQNPVMKTLYRLHHLLASQGKFYFKKFKLFSNEDLNNEDEQQIMMYCEKFLDLHNLSPN